MANKNKKANDAILMAILQDLQGNGAASTASIAMANIKRDGADQNDIHEIAANEILDNSGNLELKIKNQFSEHPEILKELSDFAEKNNVSVNSIEDFGQLIALYLKQVRGYAIGGKVDNSGETWIDVQIGNKTYNLLVATTEEEKERGLMFIESLEPNEGMLFDYSDEPQAELSFWMKNVEIPLDIIFVNQDGVVISVKQGVPNSEEYITESSEFISCVIEVNANSGIKAGDKTDLFEENNEDDEDEDFEDHPELNVNRLYVYGSDGEVQGALQGGERIFSRKSTAVIIRKAKKAYLSKEDKDYKSLGKYIFKEMDAQDNRPAEYVEGS